jgi:hypothetical protein
MISMPFAGPMWRYSIAITKKNKRLKEEKKKIMASFFSTRVRQ